MNTLILLKKILISAEDDWVPSFEIFSIVFTNSGKLNDREIKTTAFSLLSIAAVSGWVKLGTVDKDTGFRPWDGDVIDVLSQVCKAWDISIDDASTSNLNRSFICDPWLEITEEGKLWLTRLSQIEPNEHSN